MTKVISEWIADDAVTKEKINSDVAGDGLSQAAGGELDVNVDDTTIETSTDTLQVKDLGIGTAKLAATSVEASKLGSDVAGNGLGGGNGSALVVAPDTTGGANIAQAVNVSANGVGIKVDDSSIEGNGSNQLAVKANGIGPTEIDQTDNYAYTGTMDLSGAASVSVPTPTQDGHAATKGYVDAASEGKTPKGVAKALSDSNLPLSGLPGTVDGVTGWSNDDIILLTNQTDPIENGLHKVNSSNWSRPDNFAAGSSAAGATVWIDSGTSYGNQRWVCTSNAGSDVVDTNSLAWQFDGGLSDVDAGTGLTKSGNEVRVGDGSTGNINGINRTADNIAAAVDDSTVEVAANVIQVKDLGITTAKLAATSVEAAKLGSDVAGDGLGGGNGSALTAVARPTGTTNIAAVIDVAATGISVKTDDTTIAENGSNQLGIPDNGVTETQLNTSVAGTGISGGGGSALAIDIAGLPDEATADNADSIIIRDNSDGGNIKEMTRANFLAGVGAGGTPIQVAHKITAGETTNGYFTLPQTPVSVGEVTLFPQGGPPQVNKQIIGATGVTADFDVLSTNQIHFNNNGAATGLSEHLTTDHVVFITFTY